MEKKTSLSRAFFLELILALAIFSGCAVICFQVFALASMESARSEALTDLSIKAQQIAEDFKASGGTIDELAIATEANQQGHTLYWFYDRELQATSQNNAYFTLQCELGQSATLTTATIKLIEHSPSARRTGDSAQYAPKELFSYYVSVNPASKVVPNG